jgi:hypothetical protein
MKTLLSLLFAVLLTVSVSAQNYAPKVTLNCDSTLTIEQLSAGGDCYYVEVTKGGTWVEQTLISTTQPLTVFHLRPRSTELQP